MFRSYWDKLLTPELVLSAWDDVTVIIWVLGVWFGRLPVTITVGTGYEVIFLDYKTLFNNPLLYLVINSFVSMFAFPLELEAKFVLIPLELVATFEEKLLELELDVFNPTP